MEPKYKVGDSVLATLAAPGGRYVWRLGVIKSVTLKYVGQMSKPIDTPDGHNIVEGGHTLGPLYWVAIQESRLNEAPRWECELKDIPSDE